MRASPRLLLISTRSSTNTASTTLSPPFPRPSMNTLENISLAAERRPPPSMSLKPKQPRSTSSSSLLRSTSIQASFTKRSEKPRATVKAEPIKRPPPPPPPSFLLSSSPPKPTRTQSKAQPPPSTTSNPFTNPPSSRSTSTPFSHPPDFGLAPPPPLPSSSEATSASSLPLSESIALRLAYLFDPERILRERPKPGLSPRRVGNEGGGRSLTPLEALMEKSRMRKWEREECRPVKG